MKSILIILIITSNCLAQNSNLVGIWQKDCRNHDSVMDANGNIVKVPVTQSHTELIDIRPNNEVFTQATYFESADCKGPGRVEKWHQLNLAVASRSATKFTFIVENNEPPAPFPDMPVLLDTKVQLLLESPDILSEKVTQYYFINDNVRLYSYSYSKNIRRAK